MDSIDLQNQGFHKLVPFYRLVSEIPKKNGVYIICFHKNINRLLGLLDILYIGSTNNFYHQFMENFIKGSGGQTTQRIHYYLIKKDYQNQVSIAWKKIDDYKYYEKDLLKQFEEDHHELPPFNRVGYLEYKIKILSH